MRIRFAALLAVAAMAAVVPAEDAAEFPWLKDLDAARARAKAEGKPLLIVFR